jgi:ligand-binding sensor domain-containing protein
MTKQIFIILVLLTFLNSYSQNLFSEKADDCHKSKFSFCLDCGETKAQSESNINQYFKKKLTNISSKLKGQVFVQVIVDSIGNQCVKSLESKTNKRIKKLKLKDKINSMTDWKPAISKGKNRSATVILEFTFSNGQVETKYKRFNTKNRSNMKSVGSVEIKKKRKFKNKLNPDSFEVYTTQNSILPWDMSRAITIDENKVIWYGTDNGIVKIKNGKMNLINQSNSPLRVTKYNKNKANSIMDVAVNSQNNKWFSDGYNAYKYDNENWTVYDSINSKMSWSTKIYADKSNNVYFTTFKGLVIYNGEDWSIMNKTNTKLPSNRIMGVFKDSKNRLWIGTNKGNIRIEGNEIEHFQTTDNPLKTSTLIKGYEDSNGDIWFSLYEKFPQTKGFAKYKTDGTWEVISTENANIPKNDVLDFAIDEKNNRIWLSINKVGLSMFDGKKWSTLTPENSNIPSTYIQSIIVDDKGNLWCATFAGLLKIRM